MRPNESDMMYRSDMERQDNNSSRPGSPEAPDIGLTSTALLAPDPIFFYGSGYFRFSASNQPRLREPYGITNMGLSITLPAYHSPWSVARLHPQTPFGQMRPSFLAFIPLHHDLHVAGFGFELPRENSSGKRCSRVGSVVSQTGWDDSEQKSIRFRARLLSFKISYDIFYSYFKDTSVLVPRESWQSINQRDTVNDVGVWLLEAHNGPQLTLFDDAQSPWRKRAVSNAQPPWRERAVSNGALWNRLQRCGAVNGGVFRITWSETEMSVGKVDYHLYVLVRAHKPGRHLGGATFWNCRVIEPAPGSGSDSGNDKIWLFDKKALSLFQILALRLDPLQFREPTTQSVMEEIPSSPSEFSESLGISLTERIGDVLFCIKLEGAAKFVANPESCIRFLHCRTRRDVD